MVNKHYFAPSQVNGNVALIKSLKKMGINFYSGITGGGVAHFLTSLSPYAGFSQKKNSRPSFLTILEYISGFIPIGYYLASGKISASITTTGAAIKLASCGMNDAKLHNIPAVYLVPLNPKNSKGLAPMQDVSSDGMNIIPQLKAELGDGCVVINSIKGMAGQLKRAQKILSESRPVAIAFYPDILTKAEDVKVGIYKIQNFQKTNEKDLNKDLNKFLITAKNKKIVIFVGEEAARSKNIQKLTTQFAELLQAPTVWSINGINAVSHENNYGYGQILFGGNDKSIELWKNIKKDGDYVIIMLGFDPGEFILNFEKIRASYVWHFTNFKKPYGSKNGNFKHRVAGEYQKIRGDIGLMLKKIIPRLKMMQKNKKQEIKLLKNYNYRKISGKTKNNCVDLLDFYSKIQNYWRPNSVGFDDICTSYKDRQYIAQRPHQFIKFFSMYSGSAMGGAFGLGVGAKIANPDLHTFIFSGDGCWRFFGSALADAANFGLRLFILNNGIFSLINQAAEVTLPDVHKDYYHVNLPSIDFLLAAKAHGWDAYKIKPNLSNLKDIMDICYSRNKKSTLIEVPIDSSQLIGPNSYLVRRWPHASFWKNV